MKKAVLFFLAILFFSLIAYSQHTPKQWVLGQGNGATPYFENNTIIFTDTGTYVQGLPNVHNPIWAMNASIADPLHPLLFYSNGVNIYNWQHNMIMNGDSLNPCYFTFNLIPQGYSLAQMDAFIPDPGDTNRFYLFHASGDLLYNTYPGLSPAYMPNKLYYTLVDKTLDSGNGGVVTKNNIIGNDTLGWGLLAIKHGNGRDWWIITRHNHLPRFYTWLVTPSGVSGPFMQQIGPIAYAGFVNLKYGYLTNQVLGFRNWHTLDSMYIDIYNFDRCTGVFSSSFTLSISYNQYYAVPGGCEVSSSGRYLYAGTMLELHQYDMLGPNLVASDILIDNMPLDTAQLWGCPYGAMQLGPDGRIYIGSNHGSDFHSNVINYPDSAGLACNVVRHGITFPAIHFQDWPNIPRYEQPQLYNSACDSLSAGINDVLQQQPTLQVYPNPATQILTISNTLLKNNFTVTVYDRLGKKVIEAKNQTTIHISLLTVGVYVVEVREKDRVLRAKFLKSD